MEHCSVEAACFSLICSPSRPVFRSVPETERHAFLGAKKHAKNPQRAILFNKYVYIRKQSPVGLLIIENLLKQKQEGKTKGYHHKPYTVYGQKPCDASNHPVNFPGLSYGPE